MDLTSLATSLFTTAVVFGAILLWCFSVAMIIFGGWMIIKGRGNERLFGLALVAVILLLLPKLVEDYPYELAKSTNVSWDKTMPEIERLGQKMVETFSNAVAGVGDVASDPPPPTGTPFFDNPLTPQPEATDDPAAGGGAPDTLPTPYLSPTPTAIMQLSTPTLAPTATPEPTETPGPPPGMVETVQAIGTQEAAAALGLPPTPIIMTPSNN